MEIIVRNITHKNAYLSKNIKQCLLLFMLLSVENVRCQQQPNIDTLMYVHIVVRHGSRTPDSVATFPNMPNREATYYPFGDGQLNLEGKREMYQVGKSLRERYGKFLGPDYNLKLAKITSSGLERCRMSTQVLLAGLFPPSGISKIVDHLNWQPILYTYENANDDHLLATHARCTYVRNLTIPDNIRGCTDREFMYSYLSKYSGWNLTNPTQVMFILDSLLSQQANGFDLPDWMRRVYPEPIRDCAMDMFKVWFGTERRISYFGGNLIKSILDDTALKINSNPDFEEQKISLYIAHDLNLYVLMYIMDIFGTVINLAAYLIFEVHNIEGVYGFKIYLENHDGSGLTLLDIPNYGTFCSFDKMLQAYEKYFPIDWCPY